MLRQLTVEEIEVFSKVVDYEVNKLFQEIRSKFKRTHLLHEHEHVKRRFWGKKTEIVYTLYVSIGDGNFQVMTFRMDNGTTALCVKRSYILAYFYGLINGMDDTHKQTYPVEARQPQMN